MGRVTDFSLSVMRVNEGDYPNLTPRQHELLRFYSNRSWRDGPELCFEMPSYRVQEVLAASFA